MTNYTRMFRGKMRMSTCRIILITSLAWLLIDVILIMKYTDGLNGGLFKKSRDNEVSELETESGGVVQCLRPKTHPKVKALGWKKVKSA